MFHFIIEVITALATSHPEAAMKLFLHAAQATDECGYHAISSDSKAQVNGLTLVIGTLLNCKHFPTEDYEALITKVRVILIGCDLFGFVCVSDFMCICY